MKTSPRTMKYQLFPKNSRKFMKLKQFWSNCLV